MQESHRAPRAVRSSRIAGPGPSVRWGRAGGHSEVGDKGEELPAPSPAGAHRLHRGQARGPRRRAAHRCNGSLCQRRAQRPIVRSTHSRSPACGTISKGGRSPCHDDEREKSTPPCAMFASALTGEPFLPIIGFITAEPPATTARHVGRSETTRVTMTESASDRPPAVLSYRLSDAQGSPLRLFPKRNYHALFNTLCRGYCGIRIGCLCRAPRAGRRSGSNRADRTDQPGYRDRDSTASSDEDR